MTRLRRITLVAAGGALGGLLRIAAATLVPIAAERPEWSAIALLLVNLSGSLAAGFLRGILGRDDELLDAFLLAGLCGGYTSYSGFVAASAGDSAWIAVATLVCCPAAALAGMRLSGGYPARSAGNPR